MGAVIVEGKGSFVGEFGASHCNRDFVAYRAIATRSSQNTLGEDLFLVTLWYVRQ